ncbi:MFS transporter [Gephyromycinifex aptenodytis]|uniref:MFS transporter n=1 Tax=Gephyromycinifex aptenodytis TaxID=2716227 RepID=UPI001445C06F|nr:MFS transporter [Gephyromycinifex aptenodytis]
MSSAAPAKPIGVLSPSYRGVTITLVALVTIIAFEALAISTVMPRVAHALNAGGDYGLAFSFLFTTQLLGIVVADPWIGRSGPMPALWGGQVLFAGGSLLCGLAPTFSVLLLGRLVAGAGAGLVIVAIYVVIGAVYEPRLRPAVFSWISAAWVLPSIIGPVVAARLTAWLTWRSVFLLMVPAVALTMLALARYRQRLGHRPPAPPAGSRERARRALVLGLTIALGGGLVQWSGTQLTSSQRTPVVFGLIGAVLLAIAVPRLLPPGALRLARGLPSVTVARGLMTAAFNGSVTFIPLMLVHQRGFGLDAAGALLALASIGWAGGAYLQGRPAFAGRHRRFMALGAMCATVGTLSYAIVMVTHAPVFVFVLATTVVGLGMGLATASSSVLTLQLAPRAQHAEASSALQLSDVLGSMLGIALTSAVFATWGRADADRPEVFAVQWLLMTLVAALAVVASLRLSERAPVRRGSPPAANARG